LEGLLEIVGLEVMAEVVRAGTHLKGWREKFQIVGAATVELWAPNEVQTWSANWYLTT